jgi:hypothetical protein
MAAALVTAACGGDDDKSTESSDTTVKSSVASTTTSASSTKTTETGDLSTAFGHIAGYELAELPASVLANAREQYQTEVSGNAVAEKAVKEINGRTISKEGENVAIVLGMSFNRSVSSQAGFQEGFVNGAAGDDASPVTLSGEDAVAFTQPDGTQGVVFAKDRLGLLVISTGEATSSELQDIMSKLIGNNV